MRRSLPVALLVLTTVGAGLALLAAPGLQVLQEGFEGRAPLWVKGATDARPVISSHTITEEGAHRGQRCEHLSLTAEQGTQIHYTFDVGRAPVGESLSGSVWIKANRPGVQLGARIVLPKEPHPERLDERMTVFIRGEQYASASRWGRLDLGNVPRLLREQQQLMRVESKRDFDLTDAYIDRLILNIYSGPGLTHVWIDDLEVSPVVDATAYRTTGRERPAPDTTATPGATRAPILVEQRRDQLMVRGERYFFRAIRYTDTPLEVLRTAGFNTLWLEGTASDKVLEEASRLGFLLVPSVPMGDGNDEGARRAIQRFVDREEVIFWDLGSGSLAKEQEASVGRLAGLVRARDPQRPLAADIWDGFETHSRNVGMVGVHRWPLGTGLELVQYRDWLTQRRRLMPPGTLPWTWVQTHLPDWFTSLVYERPGPGPGFTEPIGPQPEQIRLLTYLAVASGCRGLGFWSDLFLADSHHGRDRLLTLALLNQELSLLEPVLLTAETPTWIDTSHPSIKAAVIRFAPRTAGERRGGGILVLPIWVGSGSQFVPGQAAASNLSFTVPVSWAEAWEVTPAEVRRVDRAERVLGGTQITLNEFGLTTAVIFTNDHEGLLVEFQKQVSRARQSAAYWSYRAAESELTKVQAVHEELEGMGHRVSGSAELLSKALVSLNRAADRYRDNNYSEAYREAQRGMRPLRILMRAHWEEATREADLQPAVASPYAVSYFTLPRHWRFMDQVRATSTSSTVLRHGNFELSPGEAPPGWVSHATTLDEVDLSAERVADAPKEGRQCLKLAITPKNPMAPPVALERTFLAIHSPEVRLTPGSLVKISGWVKIPKTLLGSADGALLYDSIGGEPLAVRLTGATPWKAFQLYRRVPASGTVSLTMALTGMGTAYFDDLRIEPLLGAQAQRN